MAGHSHDHDHGHDHAGHYHPEPSDGPIHFSDPAQESLSQALQSGFNVLRVIMLVLVIAYFASGWFQVKPGEQGLIARFGQLRTNTDSNSPLSGKPVFGPGWHASLPDPFDQKIRIPGTTQTVDIDTFCFKRDPKNASMPLSQQAPQVDRLTPEAHGTMLSGDRNLSFGLWKIEYRIDAGEDFVRNVGESAKDAEMLVRRMGESAITRAVASMPVERVTRVGAYSGDDFTLEVRRILQSDLTRLQTGIVVDKVTAETLYPSVVHQAFVGVSNASNQALQARNDALKERTTILSKAAGAPEKYEPLLAAIEAYGAAQNTGSPEAKLGELRSEIDRRLEGCDGEVAARLRAAQTEASDSREKLRREYELFQSERAQYQRFPQLTVMRLWARMREVVLTSLDNEIMFVPNSDEIRIQTNRDPQRVLEQDERRYKERFIPKPNP